MRSNPKRNKPIYPSATRVTLSNSDNCVKLCVYARGMTFRKYFYLLREPFREWLEHGKNEHLEMDCGNLLHATKFNDIVTLRFYWLNVLNDNRVMGTRQTLSLPLNRLLDLVQSETNGSMFTYDGKYDRPPRFDFTHAQRTLQGICAQPQVKRALSKALRNRSASRCNDTIQMYNDFGLSFYMIVTSKGGGGYNGGLILHKSEKNGRPYVYYGVHT